MGAIQGSFNQLLGIAAVGTATVGKQIGEHKLEEQRLNEESGKLDKELDVAEQRARETQTKMQDYIAGGGDKRRKAYIALKRQQEEQTRQVNDFAERIKLLNEKTELERGQFLGGIFGANKALKKSIKFNREIDEVVEGE